MKHGVKPPCIKPCREPPEPQPLLVPRLCMIPIKYHSQKGKKERIIYEHFHCF